MSRCPTLALLLLAAAPLRAVSAAPPETPSTAPATAAASAVAAGIDLLRFTNGDQLQGQFGGIDSSGRISWRRTDVAEPMDFQREKVRQIVLRNGRPAAGDRSQGLVELINGDRIPGLVSAVDASTVTVETATAGTLTLPRDVVATLSPNPFGGRLLYAGPFDAKDWRISNAQPAAPDLNPFANDNERNRAGDDKEEKKDDPSWSHAGASWYFRHGSDGLLLDPGTPDRAVIRFRLGWKTNPNIAFAFHADFAKPQPKEKKEGEGGGGGGGRAMPFGGPQNFARMFGNAYVLNFSYSFAQLFRCSFDEDGNPRVDRVRATNPNIHLRGTDGALFEIRCDRRGGTVALFIDDEFAAQWNTAEDAGEAGEAPPPAAAVEPGKAPDKSRIYGAPGSGIGFQVLGTQSPVRISDIVVAEWNGMTDSARSMESDQHDIVLLTNGTDRFSGKVTTVKNGELALDGRYSGLTIPLEDVAEVHLAREARRKSEEPRPGEVTVHLQPVGRVTGIPLSSDGRRIRLDSAYSGAIDLDLAPAVVIEFQSTGGFLDEWDDQF